MSIYIFKSEIKHLYKQDDFLLEHNVWNDWWMYENLYTLYHVNNDRRPVRIGQVKIGQVANRSSSIPDLPSVFDALDSEVFVSLGQDTSYYEKLNRLPHDLRVGLLVGLNDIAFNTDYLVKYRKHDVISKSLLRDFSITTVQNQFHRLATGGVKLTDYEFSFRLPAAGGALSENSISFSVNPESCPPTNIHVLIGRNGVGKTWLLGKMINSIYAEDDSNGRFDFAAGQSRFANIVCVAFSVFDNFPRKLGNDQLKYTFIGVKSSVENRDLELDEQFAMSLTTCMSNSNRYNRWKEIISVLDSDPIFADVNLVEQIDYIQSNRREYTRDRAEKEIATLFDKLSSGHKIVALTLTRLVETVEECTLVLLDEPELHLHPPLLSAFTRALSQLLTNRNGVAIITTHSPVILQEVPQSCVWILRRSGKLTEHFRPVNETFGENVGKLTTEVFGLEVLDSGFHKMLQSTIKKNDGDFDAAVSEFDGQLGSEALAILKVLSLHYGG